MVEVASVDQGANAAQSLGGVPRAEPWSWHSRRFLDIIDLEGNIFQVFEHIRSNSD
jgi:hypothetical protein